MNEIKNISKNSVFYFISTLSRLVSNVVIFLLIARHYGPQLFGSFSSAHTLSMLYLLIADFGFDLLLTTEIAKNRENVSEIVNRFVPSKMVLIIISCLLLLLSG